MVTSSSLSLPNQPEYFWNRGRHGDPEVELMLELLVVGVPALMIEGTALRPGSRKLTKFCYYTSDVTVTVHSVTE